MSTDFLSQTQRLMARHLVAELPPYTRGLVEDCARDMRWLIARNEVVGKLALLLVATEAASQ